MSQLVLERHAVQESWEQAVRVSHAHQAEARLLYESLGAMKLKLKETIDFYERQLRPVFKERKGSKQVTFFDFTDDEETRMHATVVEHAALINKLRQSNKRLS